MATDKKDVLGDFAAKKTAESDARMKTMNPKGRKLDRNGNPVVTKEELDKSGMSLRDFLNKERGLTARKDTPKKADATAKDKPAAARGVTFKPVTDSDIARARDAVKRPTSGPETNPGQVQQPSAKIAMDKAEALAREETAIAKDAKNKLASDRRKSISDSMEATKARMSERREEKGGFKLAPSPKEVAKGPSTEEKAAAAAARTKKAKADMEDTKARMSARREEKGGFKLFPKMASGGAVKAKGMGMARGSKVCKVM